MLSRCCNLTTLPLPYPLSFDRLDTHGNGIAESSWELDDTSAGDATELKWEFDEDLGRYYVSFPID